MSSAATDLTSPLTLSEQLDAMLFGWLERRARTAEPPLAEVTARALVPVADGQVAEVMAFCARWDLAARPAPRNHGGWTTLGIAGRLLPVEGVVEIAALLRHEVCGATAPPSPPARRR